MRATWVWGVALAVGCSDAGAVGPVDVKASCVSVDAYPACPYSDTAELGRVIPNRQFIGRFSGAESERRPIELAELHALRASGKRLLVFNVAAHWCGPCRTEAEKIQTELLPMYGPKGVVFFSVILQNGQGKAATDRDVDTWIDAYSTTFPIVRDPEGWTAGLFNAQTMPFNMIVDLETMRVESRVVGADLARITAKLDELLGAAR